MSGEDLVERLFDALTQGENFLGLTFFFVRIAILFFDCEDWISSHGRSLLKLQGVHAEGYHHTSNLMARSIGISDMPVSETNGET